MLARLERCWRAWPRPLAAEARRYSVGNHPAAVPAVRLGEPLRYAWLLLPEWLSTRLALASSSAERRFLADVQWAQYALFLFVRIHDDLVDRQARSSWLIYAADRYLVESETAFARHVSTAFWPLFRTLVRQTLDGIAEADALQRGVRTPRAALLDAYTRVSSIFKAASAAVLMRHGRLRLLPRAARFQDHLAVASQILDDLVDLDDDLADGRRNYVASALAGSARPGPRGRRGLAATMARRILADDALAPILDEVDRRLQAAARAIAPLHLARANRHVAGLRGRVEALRQAAHTRRVRELARIALD